MPYLVRAFCLTAALAIAAPTLAQQGLATKFDVAKLTRKSLRTRAPPSAKTAALTLIMKAFHKFDLRFRGTLI